MFRESYYDRNERIETVSEERVDIVGRHWDSGVSFKLFHTSSWADPRSGLDVKIQLLTALRTGGFIIYLFISVYVLFEYLVIFFSLSVDVQKVHLFYFLDLTERAYCVHLCSFINLHIYTRTSLCRT